MTMGRPATRTGATTGPSVDSTSSEFQRSIREAMRPRPSRLLIHHDHQAVIIGEPTRAAIELLDAGSDPYDLPEQLARACATTITHARNRRTLALGATFIALVPPIVVGSRLLGARDHAPWVALALVLVLVLVMCVALPAPVRVVRPLPLTGPSLDERLGIIHPTSVLIAPVAGCLQTLTIDDLGASDLDRIARLAATHGTPCGGAMLVQGEAADIVMALVSCAKNLNRQRDVPGVAITQCPAFDQQTHARAIADAVTPTPIPADLQQLWISADGRTLDFTMGSFAGQLPTLIDTLTRGATRA